MHLEQSTGTIAAKEQVESPRRPRAIGWIFAALFLAAIYLVTAYVVLPLAWERYEHRHPSFDDNPRITQTGDGHPGDPLNVALIATELQIHEAMRAAKWYPASALSLRSDLKIAADTVLSRPDDEAPVSSLFLFGRKEDLAFEQPVGNNPRKRHHVRFWQSNTKYPDGRPAWIGAATYDERVGLSHTTGQITHHVSPHVDADRDLLLDDLNKAGKVDVIYGIDNFHKTRQGWNGGGDPWQTDGRLFVGVLSDD